MDPLLSTDDSVSKKGRGEEASDKLPQASSLPAEPQRSMSAKKGKTLEKKKKKKKEEN